MTAALVPVVKAPVIQTSINMNFNTDDMVHLAVEQTINRLELEYKALEKEHSKAQDTYHKTHNTLHKKMNDELKNIFKDEISSLKKIFPKINIHLFKYNKNQACISLLNCDKKKPLTTTYKNLEKELNDSRNPVDALYRQLEILEKKMNRTTLTSKYKAKIAKIKLKELKAQGVDLLKTIDLND